MGYRNASKLYSPSQNAVAALFERGELVPHIGSVVALEQARTAHEMLAGAAHKQRKNRADSCRLTAAWSLHL
jgi:hypothetical protein